MVDSLQMTLSVSKPPDPPVNLHEEASVQPPIPLHSQSGAALVLVLACLALLTVVVISLIVAATQELNTAKSYSEQVQTRVLAASTLELVKGQIWAATTETNSGAAATSWASQPGAIRTFKSGDTNLLNVYKLYSSDTMVVPNSSYTAASDWATDWASRPNEFVDLNRPVVVGGVTNYPIFNPTASGSVAGFTNNASSVGVATPTSPLPMPVQWIYVRRDGSLTNYSGATNFNSTNPVVGRIAFWTDDDTCKINVNTAGAAREGEVGAGGNATQSFWDIPRGRGVGPTAADNTERNLAKFQMAQREYQRYPGHPARIDMKTVFPFLTATQVYNLTPRVSGSDATGGSYGGTRVATAPLALKAERLYATLDEVFYNTNRAANNASVTAGTLNQLNGFVTAYNRAPELNLFGRPRVSMWPLNADPSKRLPLDKWFATCSSMAYGSGGGGVSGTNLFSVTRSDSTSPTADLTCTGATIPTLFKYLQDQTAIAPPGYADSFSSKYGAAGRDQLITLSLDYIRCVNLYDSSVLPGQPGYSTYVRDKDTKVHNTNAFTPGTLAGDSKWMDIPYTTGYGQVVPLMISPTQVPTSSGSFKGLGRMDTTISEAALHFWALSWNGDNGSNGMTAQPVREDDQIVIGGVTDTVKNFAANPANFFKICQVGNPVSHGSGAPMYAAQVLVSPFNPMMGYCNYNPNYFHKISGLSGLSVTTSLGTSNIFSGAPDPGYNLMRTGGGPFSMQGGGGKSYHQTVQFIGQYGVGGKLVDFSSTAGSSTANASPFYYPFASNMFAVPDGDDDFTISGANLSFEILSPGGVTIQTLALNFPGAPIAKPLPYLVDIGPPVSTDNKPYNAYSTPLTGRYDHPAFPGITIPLNQCLSSGRRTRTIADNPYSNCMFAPGDVVMSLEANGSATDYRWLSLQQNGGANLFQTHPNYATADPNTVACGLREPYNPVVTYIVGTGTGTAKSNGGTYLGNSGNNRLAPFISSRYAASGVTNSLGKAPDFETGSGNFYDGAFARKPDEGVLRYPIGVTIPTPAYYSARESGGDNSQDWNALAFDLFFAPNRQVPSPGIMGGLPSRGTDPNGAWETLLFCPNPAAGATSSDHRGFRSPPDYLWMDLFTMPIVEPYAISEPFSTAGKINLNYQIVPFTYVTRSTGMRAVLAANRVSAISSQTSPVTDTSSLTIRYPIHADETIKQFQAKFDSNDSNQRIFKSASEICSMWLYPGNTTTPTTALVTDSAGSSSNIQNWWYGGADAGRKFTGDNLREQPYTALYQNLTTQSNTYTVHVYVQALDQTPSGKLIVTGEYRGSYALERFLDPKDPNLPDFTKPTEPNAMGYYQFRVNNTTQFLP